jgi:hypothetical protein
MSIFYSITLIYISLLICLGINEILDAIAAFSYPTWLTNAVPFLPELDLRCIATQGKTFLNTTVQNSTQATVNAFFDAITNGCSFDGLVLSGGYDTESQDLRMDIFVETKSGRSV